MEGLKAPTTSCKRLPICAMFTNKPSSELSKCFAHSWVFDDGCLPYCRKDLYARLGVSEVMD